MTHKCKGGDTMETTTIFSIATMFATWIFGLIAKKSKYVNNHLIPIQNIAIGLIVAGVKYLMTKDFDVAVAVSGVLAGGIYDIPKNLIELSKNKDKEVG